MLECYAFHLCLFRRLLKRHLWMLAFLLACLLACLFASFLLCDCFCVCFQKKVKGVMWRLLKRHLCMLACLLACFIACVLACVCAIACVCIFKRDLQRRAVVDWWSRAVGMPLENKDEWNTKLLWCHDDANNTMSSGLKNKQSDESELWPQYLWQCFFFCYGGWLRLVVLCSTVVHNQPLLCLCSAPPLSWQAGASEPHSATRLYTSAGELADAHLDSAQFSQDWACMKFLPQLLQIAI